MIPWKLLVVFPVFLPGFFSARYDIVNRHLPVHPPALLPTNLVFPFLLLEGVRGGSKVGTFTSISHVATKTYIMS